MPSSRTVIHGLSRSLRPSLNEIPPSGFVLGTRPTLRPLRRYLKNPARENSSRSFSQAPRVASRSQAWKIYGGGQKAVEKGSKFTTTQLRDQDRVRQLALGTAYQTLRQTALGGQYSQTQACISILVKERGEEPNLRLYDALLLANADHEHGSASEIATLLEELASEDLTPDSATYHAALRALAIHPDYLLRYHVLEELRQRWFPLNKDGWHSVVAGLVRDRQLENALDTMERMRKDGVRIEPWLYDMMVYTLCSAEEFDSAVALMEYRLSDGELNISGSLWHYLLDTASRALHHRATLFAYQARVETSYLNPPAGICINILSTAARYGDTYLATSVLRVLGQRSGNPIQLHHYEALLDTYMELEDLRTSLTLLTIMTAAGHTPTESSTRPIYTHLCKSDELPKRALAMLQDLREQDRKVPIQAINVTMQANIAHGDLAAALEIYKTLHTISPSLSPNTSTFNILFRGCAQATRKDLAMFLASEMLALKVAPDALTYDRLILVCLNSEVNIYDAWRYFEEMKALEWWPRDGTIVALVRRACEDGDARVWKLVDDLRRRSLLGTRSRGIVVEHWKGGAVEAERLLEGKM